MADRLTQLQVCLDQLMEQFCAALNYVDKSHGFSPLGPGEPVVADKHAPPLPPQEEFLGTVDELSGDIILKTRQLMKLIDSLPGVDVSEAEQLRRIDSLQQQLVATEQRKINVVREKDQLLRDVDQLISMFVAGIADSRQQS
ncbi:Srb7p KNAG_0F03440 [Huiozyma naganishii CBS 8797]|uniref:Mediator of RNA polymerase II transcription subunit 21 n=1 Tax=Huiozyma naganishii (strain ATCC MYA-139 / BCRC 22969 / CBS 8797 / KCTC 17520 / NBRC 10181 / NCYC 3082 / Yp74L-3) TaxID=1071383 RepID=J7S8P2_HUIN7|nr:hypothetical protein KNAG_0F03440 [Kazachstania naganishii CBS 8797]CCK71006.1 hypothetical protein KNAG_0F03440 [Kazachstania naganishii CBS 8797]